MGSRERLLDLPTSQRRPSVLSSVTSSSMILILFLVLSSRTDLGSCDVTDSTNATGVLLRMPKPPATGEQTVFLTTNQLLEGTTVSSDKQTDNIAATDFSVEEDSSKNETTTQGTTQKVDVHPKSHDKDITHTMKIPLNAEIKYTTTATTTATSAKRVDDDGATTTEDLLVVRSIDDPDDTEATRKPMVRKMTNNDVEKGQQHHKKNVILPSASPVPPVSHAFQATPVGDLCPAFEEADRFTQTELLSRLTMDCRYDRLERPLGPANGAGPLPVAARIYVYFIQNAEAHDLSMSVTILLQFRYQDARLAYNEVAPSRTVIMGESQLRDKIWVPHVFVSNERSSQVMGTDAQSKDVLVSVAPDGTVVFSVRMKATLYCWMNLRKFPFDEQQCHMLLESWKYNTSELLLTWEPRAPVTLAPDLHLTEYILTDMWVNETIVRADLDDLRHGAFSGTYSALSFTVQLSREMGFYLMDYFIPSMMIVAISWVSFWLAADQSAPRITLGTSTMLTFITLASAQGKTLPKVSYIKASEIWFLGCTGFIFGSLVEFAFVNTIWRRKKNVELKKVNSKYILKSTLTPRLARKQFNEFRAGGGQGGGAYPPPAPLVKARSCSSLDSGQGNNGTSTTAKNYLTVNSFNKLTLPTITTTQSADDLVAGGEDQVSVFVDGSPGGPDQEESQQHHNTWTTMTPQEISMWIDTRSRLVFPAAFVVFNAFYWIFVWYM